VGRAVGAVIVGVVVVMVVAVAAVGLVADGRKMVRGSFFSFSASISSFLKR
jgi:hypothetical protein